MEKLEATTRADFNTVRDGTFALPFAEIRGLGGLVVSEARFFHVRPPLNFAKSLHLYLVYLFGNKDLTSHLKFCNNSKQPTCTPPLRPNSTSTTYGFSQIKDSRLGGNPNARLGRGTFLDGILVRRVRHPHIL